MAARVILLFLTTWFALVGATPIARGPTPTVTLDDAVFSGTSSGPVSSFLGIPFAQPPVGELRFQLPQPLPSYTGTYDATAFGDACPQQAIQLPLPSSLGTEALDYIVDSIWDVITPSSEDCLTLNVYTPSTATPDSNLPVVVWIFGGGFELGAPSEYDGSIIVSRAVDLNEPLVYVSINYRLNAFGFLASSEVKEAGVGNLGLQDQRQALRWVQQYISAFGGDPTQVTIWGESAGAISVALQMVTNGGDTEGLFRAAFMESGSPIPVGDITNGQPYYDSLVEQTGCESADDTLECLRGVDYDSLMDAINNTPFVFSYQSLILAWLPRADGVFLPEDPQYLVQQGSVADIPFVTGDCDDEGTIFSLSTINITTDDELLTYLQTYWLPNATTDEINGLLSYYTADISDGSPFNTSDLNALTPQFKRLAAFQGDAVFQAPRRFFLEQRADEQTVWSFLSKRLKDVPFLGSFHASDILSIYGPSDMTDYLINFVTTLNPNGQLLLDWPEYTTGSRNLMTFLDGLIPTEITQDVYRVEPMKYLMNLTLAYPI